MSGTAKLGPTLLMGVAGEDIRLGDAVTFGENGKLMKARAPKRLAYCCPKCKNPSAGHDAHSEWDVDKQEWILGATYQQAWCPDCGEISELECIEVQQ